MSDIKTVNIRGDAAKDVTGGGAKRTRRTAKKVAQEGGSDEPIRGVAPIAMNVKGVETSSLAAQSAPPTPAAWLTYPKTAPVPPTIQPIPSHAPSSANAAAAPTHQYAVATPTAPAQQGGNKQVKVELKKKAHTKKVQLQPKKAEHQKASPLKKTHTKKIRKVTLGVKSLHNRITRAKKLHKSIKGMPLEKLKEKLVKGGLIKESSKAPQHVLQQIARDAAIITKKAL